VYNKGGTQILKQRGALKTREWKTWHDARHRPCMSKSSRKYRRYGPADCSVLCRGGFPRSVCVRCPSRFSGRRTV